jgi:hypothetical protein
LYSAIVDQLCKNGVDEKNAKAEAIKTKAKFYLPGVVDWVDHPENTNLKLDKQGEPTEYDAIFNNKEGVEASDKEISDILQDRGNLLDVMKVLRDNNIFNREIPIQNAIRDTRNKFVRQYLEVLSKHGLMSTV